MAKRGARKTNGGTAANLGFEAKLWAAADALRNMEAAETRGHERCPDGICP